MSTHIRLVAFIALFASLAGMLLLTTGSANAQAAVRVPVGDLWFCDSSSQNGVCTTEISAGDTVVWDFAGASFPHTTTACGTDCDSPTGSPIWDSGTISDDSSFQFTFDEAGTYLYRCSIHPNQMRGQIIVTGETQEPDDEPSDVPPVATIEVVGAPAAGSGAGPADGGSPWLLAGLAAAGLALLSAGGVMVGVRRRVS